MNFDRFFLVFAAILGFLAVLIGAFGAHSLPRLLDVGSHSPTLKPFHTGAEYQFYHVFALLFVSLLPQTRLTRIAGWSFILGILLFSFSLYAMVLSGNKMLGMITPFGGMLLILGWCTMAVAAMRLKPEKKPSDS